MEIRGIGGVDLRVESIYDVDDVPAFLLGVSENGYIIMERSTYAFREGGEGNPYHNFETAKKYYGGIFCYYVVPDGGEATIQSHDIEGQIYDIHNMWTSDIMEFEIREENMLVGTEVQSVSADSSTVIIDNAYSYLQRKAFGYNADSTCSAVALGLALNYITLQHGVSFTPAEFRLEDLSIRATSVSQVESNYPKAHALHRYLADTCGMDAVTTGGGIADGLTFYAMNKVSPAYNLKLDWTLAPYYYSVESELLTNNPVLVTTGLNDDFPWHTMVVYGCRNIGNGYEVLVHTGWYNGDYMTGSGTTLHQKETWMTYNHVLFEHYFSYNTVA